MPDAAESHVSAFRAAGERRDLEALLDTLTPDVVIHSPVSERLRFEGIEQARELFGMVLEELGEINYTDEVGDDDSRVLVYRGRLAGAEVEEAQLLRLAPDGRIRELSFFIRPFPGLAGVAAGLAPALARHRHHGRLRILLMSIFGSALRVAIAIGDRIGARLLG